MSNNKGLQFGLNVKPKTGSGLSGRSLARAKPSIFGRSGGDQDSSDEDDEERRLNDDDEDNESNAFSRPPPPKKPSQNALATASVNKTLRPYAATTLASKQIQQQVQAAIEQDANVFDYDAVYDDLKAGDRAKELAKKQDSLDRKPKHVAALLLAAEQRKRDRKQIEENRITKEREREGEEFKDKEQFVTEAYKLQKEKQRQQEELDRKREEELAKDKDGTQLKMFYANMLNERTKSRGVVDPATIGGEKDQLKLAQLAKDMDEERQAKINEDQELASRAREQGKNVVLDDEGNIVDKRELLQGGLNISKKSAASIAAGRRSDYDRDEAYRSYKASRYKSGSEFGRSDDDRDAKDQRSRMTERIQQQMLDLEKQQQEEEKEREESIRQALKRKNQDGEIMDAKARYLARKKAEAEAKNAK